MFAGGGEKVNLFMNKTKNWKEVFQTRLTPKLS